MKIEQYLKEQYLKVQEELQKEKKISAAYFFAGLFFYQDQNYKMANLNFTEAIISSNELVPIYYYFRSLTYGFLKETEKQKKEYEKFDYLLKEEADLLYYGKLYAGLLNLESQEDVAALQCFEEAMMLSSKLGMEAQTLSFILFNFVSNKIKPKKVVKENIVWKDLNGKEEWEEIGEGAEGKVYKAILDKEFPVAVKQTKRSEQIKFLSNLQTCPNIIHLIGEIKEEKEQKNQKRVFFFCMELAVYGSLRDLLKNNKHSLPWPLKEKIIKQLLDSIIELNNKKIVHRDIKPANILIVYGLNIRIADLDLALDYNFTELEKEEWKKNPGKTLPGISGWGTGTEKYIPPGVQIFRYNQINFNIARYVECFDEFDIYSTSLVIFEILTGRKPWQNLLNNLQEQSMRNLGWGITSDDLRRALQKAMFDKNKTPLSELESEEDFLNNLPKDLYVYLQMLFPSWRDRSKENQLTAKQVSDEFDKIIESNKYSLFYKNTEKKKECSIQKKIVLN